MTPRSAHLPLVVLATVILLILHVTDLRAQAARFDPPYTRFRLTNGLEVVLAPMPGAPTVTVMTLYRVGSANERPGRSGFAHLFEHLLFNDTKHVTELQRTNLLLENGGGANASTNRDYTVFATWVSSDALELALYLDAERMGNLLGGVTEQSLALERGVVMNEHRERVGNVPYAAARQSLNELVFGRQHPYGRPTLGTIEDLSAATVDDVAQFYQEYYAPGNAMLVVAGDINVDSARHLVERWHGAVAPGGVPPSLVVPDAELRGVVRVLREEPVKAPRLYVSWPTTRDLTGSSFALEVVEELFSRGIANQLRHRLVRDLRIADDVVVTHEPATHGGMFTIEVHAKADQALGPIDDEIRDALDQLVDHPPSEGDLLRLHRGLELGTLAQTESTGGRAGFFAENLLRTGRLNTFAERTALRRALTPRDIADAVLTFLRPDRRVLLSVVPGGQTVLAVPGSLRMGGAQ
jgi:zinc protease